MRFKIDENLSGRPDAEVAAAAKAESRILLSLDSDFANILLYPPKDYSGIIFLKLEKQDNPSVLKALVRPIKLLESNNIKGRLWVVTESEIRIRQ